MTSEQSTQAVVPSLPRALLYGAILVILDAFVLNQGAIAVTVGLWLLVVTLPRTFLAKKFATVRKQRLRNTAIYFVAVILVVVFNAANNSIAKGRAEILVSAVKGFRAKNQRFPKSLEELVPAYIERVPLAKYTFSFNQFYYSTFDNDSDARLFYVEVPPFGRPTYYFRENKWGYLD